MGARLPGANTATLDFSKIQSYNVFNNSDDDSSGSDSGNQDGMVGDKDVGFESDGEVYDDNDGEGEGEQEFDGMEEEEEEEEEEEKKEDMEIEV